MIQSNSKYERICYLLDQPSNIEVEYHPKFLELELAVTGKPDVQYGDTIVDATQSNWKIAESLSFELLNISLDLRVAGYLTRALLNRQGFGGFAEGLALMEGMLDRCWDSIYPPLDTDDDNDPTARINALTVLIEPSGMLTDVRNAPLVMSHSQEIVRLRDFEATLGERPIANGVELGALSMATGLPDLSAINHALQSVLRIETLLTERVGNARAIDLHPLVRLLQQAIDLLDAYFPHEKQVSSSEVLTVDNTVLNEPIAAPELSEIANRQDVIYALDKICDYYGQQEPSSPIPLLLTRARRLVDKNFIEILEDLAPEGLTQAQQISGKN